MAIIATMDMVRTLLVSREDNNMADIFVNAPELKKTVSDILIELRNQFSKEANNMSDKDPTSLLILKAKVITVGQVMDELGITDPDDDMSDEEIEALIQNLPD